MSKVEYMYRSLRYLDSRVEYCRDFDINLNGMSESERR
jgi:hypothetical protein